MDYNSIATLPSDEIRSMIVELEKQSRTKELETKSSLMLRVMKAEIAVRSINPYVENFESQIDNYGEVVDGLRAAETN